MTNALNLLEQHPKAALVVKNYYLEKLLESLNTDLLTDEFKQFVRDKGVPPDQLLSIIEDIPRNLFDVFDDNGLYIQISGYRDDWSWAIGTFINKSTLSSRKEAEKEAIVQAFKLLEGLL